MIKLCANLLIKFSVFLLCIFSINACFWDRSGSSDSSDSDTDDFSDTSTVTNTDTDTSVLETCLSTESKVENFWNYLNLWYLWYDDLPQNLDLDEFDSSTELIRSIRYRASGGRDRFSYVLSGEENDDFIAGTYVGYGFNWGPNVDGTAMVMKQIYDGSAKQLGLQRGSVIERIIYDGNPFNAQTIHDIYENGSLNGFNMNDVLGPTNSGATIDVEWRDQGVLKSGSMTQAEAITNGVHDWQVIDRPGSRVGYLSYQDFGFHTRNELLETLRAMGDENVSEFILDLRYNGGGQVYHASVLGSYFMGSQLSSLASNHSRFVTLDFNDNPNRLAQSTVRDIIYPFLDELCYIEENANGLAYCSDFAVNQPFNISRLYVLVSEDTCSASEMVINALDNTPRDSNNPGTYLDVVVIGDTTCGKPIGFRSYHSCPESGDESEVYYAVNFSGANAAGYYDYFDGIEVDCSVQETDILPWGDTDDALVSAALHHMANGSCPSSAPIVRARSKTPDKDFLQKYLRKDIL